MGQGTGCFCFLVRNPHFQLFDGTVTRPCQGAERATITILGEPCFHPRVDEVSIGVSINTEDKRYRATFLCKTILPK